MAASGHEYGRFGCRRLCPWPRGAHVGPCCRVPLVWRSIPSGELLGEGSLHPACERFHQPSKKNLHLTGNAPPHIHSPPSSRWMLAAGVLHADAAHPRGRPAPWLRRILARTRSPLHDRQTVQWQALMRIGPVPGSAKSVAAQDPGQLASCWLSVRSQLSLTRFTITLARHM